MDEHFGKGNITGGATSRLLAQQWEGHKDVRASFFWIIYEGEERNCDVILGRLDVQFRQKYSVGKD